MNKIIASSTGATSSTKELIAGWYANGSSHMDKSWVPTGWKNTTNDIAYYQNVYSRHCRTCHVNMPHDFPSTDSNLAGNAEMYHLKQLICGGHWGHWRNHTMPNSMVTFNRFWLGAGKGNGTSLQPDQITPTEQFAGNNNCYVTTKP
jgi:hypothetical protein